MLKNSFVDGGYYVDENDEMLKMKIRNNIIFFNNDGIGTIKQVPKINFIALKKQIR